MKARHASNKKAIRLHLQKLPSRLKLGGVELPAKRQILGSLCFFQLSHGVQGRILLDSILR